MPALIWISGQHEVQVFSLAGGDSSPDMSFHSCLFACPPQTQGPFHCSTRVTVSVRWLARIISRWCNSLMTVYRRGHRYDPGNPSLLGWWKRDANWESSSTLSGQEHTRYASPHTLLSKLVYTNSKPPPYMLIKWKYSYTLSHTPKLHCLLWVFSLSICPL